MRGHEAQSRDRRQAVGGAEPVDRPDQGGEVGPPVEIEPATGPAIGVDVGEARLGWQVVAVRVHVLAEQRDLAVARRRQAAGLGHDLVERPAPLRAAAERDDAVGAGLVAAVDDREPGADRRLAPDRAARHRQRPRPRQMVGRADGRPSDGRQGRAGDRRQPDRALGRGQPEPVDELGLLVGPEEEVDGRETAAEPIALGLADRAPGQHDPHAGVRGLQALQVPLPADHLLLRCLADRAGVDHDEIGRVHRRRLGASRGKKTSGHLLRVAPVHLAAEGPDVERWEGPGSRGGTRRGGRHPGPAARRGSLGTGAARSRTGRARLVGSGQGHRPGMVSGRLAFSDRPSPRGAAPPPSRARGARHEPRRTSQVSPW